MATLFRVWFILLYVLGFGMFLTELFRFRARRPVVERRTGLFPPPPGVLNWILALAILGTRVGELHHDWVAIRLVGLVLGLYAAVIVPWAGRAIGRSFVPGAGVLVDHRLVDSGPFRFVRHPIYSGVMALWLGAALGTLNCLLLALWPLLILGVRRAALTEEVLLREKLGEEYITYTERKGLLVPRILPRG